MSRDRSPPLAKGVAECTLPEVPEAHSLAALLELHASRSTELQASRAPARYRRNRRARHGRDTGGHRPAAHHRLYGVRADRFSSSVVELKRAVAVATVHGAKAGFELVDAWLPQARSRTITCSTRCGRTFSTASTTRRCQSGRDSSGPLSSLRTQQSKPIYETGLTPRSVSVE